MLVWVLPLLHAIITGLVQSETSSFVLPKYTSGDCSTDLISGGWVLLNFKESRLTLRFCEGTRSPGSGPRWPIGSYCVLRVNDLCPLSLTHSSIQTKLSSIKKGSGTIPDINKIAEDLYKFNLCCSTAVTSEPLYFDLQPPFSLIRQGARCQEIINTKVSEVAITNAESTFINLCLYQRPQVLCSECEQLCKEERCGCYEGFRLINNTHCKGINDCLSVRCDHICINTGGGHVCRCAEGYLLMEDDTTCTKFNKCLINNGGCSHYCIENDKSEAVCSCEAGYILDGKTCQDLSLDLSLAAIEPTKSYKSSEVLPGNKTHRSPPLFSTQRDYIIMVISVVVAVVLLIILSVLLVHCKVVICFWSCPKCPCHSAAKRRATKEDFRNSISAPYIGEVAMDLLNRPKRNVSLLRDLPSRHSQQSATSNNTSHYNNSNHYNNTVYKESPGYDSLRLQNKQVDALRPLITPYATSEANINKGTYDLDQPTYDLDQPTYDFDQPTYDLDQPTYDFDLPTYELEKVTYDEAAPPPPALDLIPNCQVPEYKDPSEMFRSKSFDFKKNNEVKNIPRVASMGATLGASIARITPILREPVISVKSSESPIKQAA